MLDFINNTPEENYKFLLENGIADDKLEIVKRNLKNREGQVSQLAIVYKYLYTETLKKCKRIEDKLKIKNTMDDNREHYTVQRDTISLGLSMSKYSRVSDIIGWIHGHLREYSTITGYCDNGGSHTLYITDTKVNLYLLLDMIDAEHLDNGDVQLFTGKVRDLIKPMETGDYKKLDLQLATFKGKTMIPIEYVPSMDIILHKGNKNIKIYWTYDLTKEWKQLGEECLLIFNGDKVWFKADTDYFELVITQTLVKHTKCIQTRTDKAYEVEAIKSNMFSTILVKLDGVMTELHGNNYGQLGK